MCRLIFLWYNAYVVSVNNSISYCIDVRGENLMERNQATVQDYKDAVKRYISELKKMSEEESRKAAVENLKIIGVLDQNGKEKSQIVNGDFFGW